jgi:hypothetical protein
MCVKINLPRAAALLLAAALLGFVATITLLLHQKHAERFSEPCDGNQGAGSDGYGGRTGENGVYCGQGMDNGYINVELAALLSRFLKGKTVADIGAGQGGYAKVMKAAAISVRAFDGQAGIEGFTEGLVSHADLTRPLALEPRPQWTISFEVLEHIPPHLEANFLQNVAMATEGVIISCAIVGQGGQDHINTHSNVAVRDRLAELGFVFDPRASATVRWYLHHRVMDHFSTNLMVFFRGAADNVSAQDIQRVCSYFVSSLMAGGACRIWRFVCSAFYLYAEGA